MDLKASVSLENKLAFIDPNNVIGMVKGSEKPDEVFIYMAHRDHLGTVDKIEGDGYLEKHAKAQNRILKPDAEAEKGYFYRSGHFELSKLGVPMSYPKLGYDHREKGLEFGHEMMEKSN